MRGGRTKLAHLTAPQSNYQNEEKGDALHAMELALSLEKLNFHKLRELHDVADASEDAQMADFVENMLAEQVWAFHCLLFWGVVGICISLHLCLTPHYVQFMTMHLLIHAVHSACCLFKGVVLFGTDEYSKLVAMPANIALKVCQYLV